MIGFGADLDPSLAEISIPGFGDEYVDPVEGFGSPLLTGDIPPIMVTGDTAVDTGGHIVRFYWQWPEGTCTVKMVAEDGTEYGFLRGKEGDGYNVNHQGYYLRTFTIPTPPARYGFIFRFGPIEITTDSVILVKRRLKKSGRFTARSKWQSYVNGKNVQDEPIETLSV